MGKSTSFLVICVLFAVSQMMVLSFPSVDAASGTHQYHLGWIPAAATTTCDGSLGDCLVGDDLDLEFDMDSEISRRILAMRRYISYGALSRNTVPCSRRGASYYNCRPGAQANPYSRGCSRITRCRR